MERGEGAPENPRIDEQRTNALAHEAQELLDQQLADIDKVAERLGIHEDSREREILGGTIAYNATLWRRLLLKAIGRTEQ